MSVSISRQFKSRLPALAVAQTLTKTLAGTRQAGHDRALGDLGDGRDLLVRQTFHLAEDDHLAEIHGEFFHGPSDRLLPVLAKQLSLGTHAVGADPVDLLVEGPGGPACAALLEPGVAGVAN